MVKIKKYKMDFILEEEKIITKQEQQSIIGGFTDLGDGLVALNYSEMLEIFGNPSNFPSYASDGTYSWALENGQEGYVVPVEDLGIFSIIWGLSSSDNGIGSSSNEINIYNWRTNYAVQIANETSTIIGKQNDQFITNLKNELFTVFQNEHIQNADEISVDYDVAMQSVIEFNEVKEIPLSCVLKIKKVDDGKEIFNEIYYA